MTQEEKQELLIAFCGYSPYKTRVKIGDYSDYIMTGCNVQKGIVTVKITNESARTEIDINYENVKPYLRPISSMTDEEMDKLFDILHIDKDGNDEDWIKINDDLGIKFFFPSGKWIEDVDVALDYLNSIYIDHRGLIKKGRALEATEGMY